jgi:protein O-mannosyl-transferase
MPPPARAEPGARAERGAAPAWLPYAILAAAVTAAYANALGASFQFDDWNVIVDEPRVAGLGAFWASMPGIRPLLKLSYALNNTAGSGSPGFHAVNVAIHLVNVWLVYALFARAGRSAAAGAARTTATKASAAATSDGALAGALFFALHPVQTEAVTYVSGRSSALVALFALASVLAWCSGRTTVAAPLLFAAALLVKETAVVLPVALLLLVVTVCRGWGARRILPCAVVLAGGAAVAIASPTYRRLFATSLATRGIGANLITQAHGVVYLMGQIVRPGRLNADPMLPVFEGWTPHVAVDAAVVAALAGVGLASIRRRPALALGILWFFVWLAPTNSLVPRLDVANDRELYLALMGPAWLLAALVGTVAGAVATRARRTIALAATLALAVGLGLATHDRNRDYRDEVTFWTDVVRKSPGNSRGFNNLGYALALASRNDEAEAAFLRALEIDPGHTRAAVNLRLLREGALLPGHRR